VSKSFRTIDVWVCVQPPKSTSMKWISRSGYVPKACTLSYLSLFQAHVKASVGRDYYVDNKRNSRISVGPDRGFASVEPENGRGSPSASSAPVRKGRTYLFNFMSHLYILTYAISLAAPLNLASAPSLHLLTPAEQTLCSQLRILPKPYLVIKETLVREYARRGGKLRRREARELVKIDVNKTSRVWDFLVQAGYLRIPDTGVTASTSAGDSVYEYPSHALC
jgi:transcriptional adapter 2-alpha